MHVSAHTKEEIIRKFSNRYLTINIDNRNTFFIVVEIISKIILGYSKTNKKYFNYGSCTSRSGPPPSIMPLLRQHHTLAQRRRFSGVASGMILLRKNCLCSMCGLTLAVPRQTALRLFKE